MIQIIAGPNGSGKTTFSNVYLFSEQEPTVYLNPDRIAAGIAPFDFEKASFQAGRVLINEVNSMCNAGESFTFESTLSGRTWFKLLKDAKLKGYKIVIYFLYLSSIEKNIKRIQKRVRMGGHPIPTEAVFRRHPRCFNNFWNIYRSLCDDWYIFDNSNKKPKLLQNKVSFEGLAKKQQLRFVKYFLEGKLP